MLSESLELLHRVGSMMHSNDFHSAHKKRQQMDRRRFEAAHLKYASLQMASWYPQTNIHGSIKFEGDVLESLYEITPALFDSFETKYAG